MAKKWHFFPFLTNFESAICNSWSRPPLLSFLRNICVIVLRTHCYQPNPNHRNRYLIFSHFVHACCWWWCLLLLLLLKGTAPPCTLNRVVKPYWFHQLNNHNPNPNGCKKNFLHTLKRVSSANLDNILTTDKKSPCGADL